MQLRKEQLWQKYIDKNPHWLTDGVKLTPAGLKKLFDQTFDRGHALGFANGKAIAARPKKNKNGVEDMIDNMFGFKR